MTLSDAERDAMLRNFYAQRLMPIAQEIRRRKIELFPFKNFLNDLRFESWRVVLPHHGLIVHLKIRFFTV